MSRQKIPDKVEGFQLTDVGVKQAGVKNGRAYLVNASGDQRGGELTEFERARRKKLLAELNSYNQLLDREKARRRRDLLLALLLLVVIAAIVIARQVSGEEAWLRARSMYVVPEQSISSLPYRGRVVDPPTSIMVPRSNLQGQQLYDGTRHIQAIVTVLPAVNQSDEASKGRVILTVWRERSAGGKMYLCPLQLFDVPAVANTAITFSLDRWLGNRLQPGDFVMFEGRPWFAVEYRFDDWTNYRTGQMQWNSGVDKLGPYQQAVDGQVWAGTVLGCSYQ